MHPLISQDLASVILDEHEREIERRRWAHELPPRRARKAVGLRLVSLGARLALERRQEGAFVVNADRGVQLTPLGPRSLR
jgi:hypothetical protein